MHDENPMHPAIPADLADDEALVEALTLHLWDEGIVRPEALGREAVIATLRALAALTERRGDL